MAYSITYQDLPVRQEQEQRRKNRKRFLLLVFGAAALLAWVLIPGAGEAVRQFFFPGSDGSTIQALEALARDVADGEPIGEAVYGFCQEILGEIGT